MTRGLISLLCCGVVAPLVGGRGAEPTAVLDGWFAAQANLHSWRADFTQTRFLKVLQQPLVTAGRAWFEPPIRYRWELGVPAQTIALRRADELLVIYPALKRVERYPVGQNATGQWRDALALLEAGFPRDRAAFEARFRLLSVSEETPGVWTLTLQPRSAASRRMLRELRLMLATNDFSLRRTELVFTDGSEMRNDFTNAVVNAAADAELFEWRTPAGFTITEPMAR